MANFITFLRIVCSVALIFFPAFSVWFYVLYIFAGVSDILDGFVARKTGTTSEAGAFADSVADVVFVAVCLVKIIPCLSIPLWLWICIAVIAGIRIINVISGIIIQKKLVMPHTVANKITGLALFIAPLLLKWIDLIFLAVPLCAIAAFAAIQEGHFIKTKK